MTDVASVLGTFAVAAAAASAAAAGWWVAAPLRRVLVARAAWRDLGAGAIASVAGLHARVVPARALARIDGALRSAGRPGELAAVELLAIVELAAAASTVAGAAIGSWLDLPARAWLAAPVLGALAPIAWVGDRGRARRLAITRALPCAIDLLTLGVEAGLDFPTALAKVVERGRGGPLRDELAIALRELRLGKTREEALRNLAGRVGLPTLSGFVQALVQADRMGTPLGKTLRTLGTQMRIDRTHRAEKLANEAPVKLLLPLLGCIFPTLFLMLFGPIAYQVFLGGRS